MYDKGRAVQLEEAVGLSHGSKPKGTSTYLLIYLSIHTYIYICVAYLHLHKYFGLKGPAIYVYEPCNNPILHPINTPDSP